MIQSNGPLEYLFDGASSALAGVDSSKSPDLIDENYIAFGYNITCRGGKPKTRPAFVQLSLNQSEALTKLQNDQFQGRFDYYDYDLGRSVIIQVHGGYVIKVDPVIGDVTILNPSDPNLPTPYHYFVQADKFLIIQNGTDIPFIYDGVTIRRSYTGANNPAVNNTSITLVGTTATVTTSSPHNYSTGDYIQIDGVLPSGYGGQFYITVTGPTTFTYYAGSSSLDTPASYPGFSRRAPEIPTGLFMEYVLGRIAVVSSDRRTIQVGDIIRGDVVGSVDNVLRFTEKQYIAESTEFSLPASQGRIAGIKAIPLQDTATAQQGLMVFGETGSSSIDLSVPRTEWATKPIQQIAILDVGCSSHNSILGFNGDLIFRDQLGIRSYRSARGEMQSYGQTPISAELNRVLSNDAINQLQFVSGAKFDNRMLMTCSPVFAVRPGGGTDIYHRGLAVLDFTTLSGAGGKSSASWDGVWGGLQFQAIGTGLYDGRHRCFAAVLGNDGKNEIWEITREGGPDKPADADPTPIQSVIETRAFDFQNEFELKRLLRFDIWLSKIVGSVKFKVFYKNDGEECWTPWYLGGDGLSFTRCNTTSEVLLPETNSNVDGLVQARPGIRPQVTLPQPTFGCNTETAGDRRNFFESQIRLEWTGQVTIEKYRLMALKLLEKPQATCPQGAF